ncbi:hypothetical protein DFO70_11127 [Cytobacillus firmus]|uniref:Uncharacterized protein n=2 Tax=Cytobacillus TaxID=2675230 RepID=A0A366JN71_CYTFI|nr:MULTISPECIES: hypothetical protein [Cytobacillus]RBP89380.1 hypothetical protein DFO70_11127 [Cytobacillus firmus]TDX47393.1 hypothetical protein DFO72_101490 [Cytobacillus oceanisediminis]
MDKRLTLDVDNLNHKLIITGLLGMVEDNGLSPHEAFTVLEDIKRQTFNALTEANNRRS